MKSFAGSYMISKTLTEKKLLEFASDHALDLVTLIPPFIVGPFICPKLPSSVRISLATAFGEWDQHDALLNLSMVHIDDVARAHIYLFEYPNANGRYICSFKTFTIGEICRAVTTKYSEFPTPSIKIRENFKGFKPPRGPGLSSKKLLESGFEFKYGIDEMFDGAIQCCKEKCCL
uniref:Uncharacterized protein MANES_05G045600 n=1 Tax=Rhizophora mucronata TaxID=61149 RepID=A0A2P2IXC7_RHIMU